MNGMPFAGDNSNSRGPVKADKVWNMYRSRIKKTAQKVVFVDEGHLTPDSYAVYYDQMKWFDNPEARHGDAMTMSLADGHVEFWHWKDKETLDFCKYTDTQLQAWCGYYPTQFGFAPLNCRAKNDLWKMQYGVWGQIDTANYKLGTPPDPPGTPGGCSLQLE